jgi:tetratricopeptide (TPR) repeat protein
MGSLIQLGRVELALGSTSDARRLFEEAVAAFTELEIAHSNYVVGAILGLGWTALAMEEIPLARRKFQQVLSTIGRTAWETLDAIAGLAQVLQMEGHLERATELLTLVVECLAIAHATREAAEAALRDLEIDLCQCIFTQATNLGRQQSVDDVAAALVGQGCPAAVPG